jgi:hypothetical protein
MFARLWFVVSVLWVGLMMYGMYLDDKGIQARYVGFAVLPFIVRLLFRWIAAGYWVRR